MFSFTFHALIIQLNSFQVTVPFRVHSPHHISRTPPVWWCGWTSPVRDFMEAETPWSGHLRSSQAISGQVILQVVFVNKRRHSLQGLVWFGLCEGHWWFSFPWTSIYFPGNLSRFEIGNFQSTKPQVLFFVLSFVEFIWLFGTARRLFNYKRGHHEKRGGVRGE